MGTVRLGPPRELVTRLRDACAIPWFVETGTLYGTTARWASTEFERVTTIELSDELHASVLEEHGSVENIEFVKGRSQERLPDILDAVDSPAIFWLDAHYAGEGTAGETDECPLLEEIEALGSFDGQPYVFIDDARFFYSPPPQSHTPEEWPTMSDVLRTIERELGEEYYTVITEDVIIAVPPAAKSIVQSYARTVATTLANESKVERGCKLVVQGIMDRAVSGQNIRRLQQTGLYPLARKVYYTFNPGRA